MQTSVWLVAMLLASGPWWSESGRAAAGSTDRVRFCGGMLARALSMVCQSFNSPYWDVTESGTENKNRVKRDYGISDECCTLGCTWADLEQYCADAADVYPAPTGETTSTSDSSEGSVEDGHLIADRSVEAAAAGADGAAPPGFRGLFGQSEMRQLDAPRAAPVVGTVSPLLTWGRTLPVAAPSRDRLLYVTV